MFKFLTSAALSMLIGLGAVTSLAAPANAQSGGGLYLGFGSGNHGPSIGLHFSDRGRHDIRDRDRRRDERRERRHDRRDRWDRDDRRDRWDRDDWRDRDRRAGYCSPREAVYKARRMGLRDARVVASNWRVVRVEGRRYSERYYIMTFRNARNCPVLR